MHHLAPLAPDHSTLLTARLPPIPGAGAPAPGLGDRLPAMLESLRGVAVAALCFLVWLGCSGAPQPATAAPEEEAAPFIVQGSDLATVLEAVRRVGGEITHELAVIRAVGARLTESQRAALEALDGITRVWEDRPVSIQAIRPAPDSATAGGLSARE